MELERAPHLHEHSVLDKAILAEDAAQALHLGPVPAVERVDSGQGGEVQKLGGKRAILSFSAEMRRLMRILKGQSGGSQR